MESGRRHACGVHGRGRARRQLASVCLLWQRLHGEVRSERRRHAGRQHVGALSKRAAPGASGSDLLSRQPWVRINLAHGGVSAQGYERGSWWTAANGGLRSATDQRDPKSEVDELR